MDSGSDNRELRWLSGLTGALALVEVVGVSSAMAKIPWGRASALVVLVLAVAAGKGFSASPFCARSRREPPQLPRWAASALAALPVSAALLWLLSLVAAVCKHDFSFDGNTYHLPTTHFWAERGFPWWIDWTDPPPGSSWSFGLDLFNAYPKGAELVSFVTGEAFGSAGDHLANLLFMPLGALGIASIARELGASAASSRAAGALFMLAPVNMGQAPTSYVDTAYAASLCAALAFVAVLVGCVMRGDSFSPVGAALRIGAAAGLALGIKGSGILHIAVLLGIAALALGWSAWRSGEAVRALLLRQARVLVLAVVAATAVGGYWYARNALYKGNPLGPFRVAIAGHTIFPGEDPAVLISEKGNTPPEMQGWSRARQLLWTWTQTHRFEVADDAYADGWKIGGPKRPAWPSCIRYVDPRHGGLGFAWLLGCVPATLWCAWILFFSRAAGPFGRAADFSRTAPGDRDRRAVLLFLVAFGALAMAVQPMSWWSRYTVWLYGTGAPAVALALDAMVLRGRAALPALAAVLGGLAIFEAAYAFVYASTPRYFLGPVTPFWPPADFVGALTRDERPHDLYWGLRGPLAVEAVAGTEPVGLSLQQISAAMILGQLCEPFGSRRIVLLDGTAGAEERFLLDVARKTRLRWVLWNAQIPAPALEHIAVRKEPLGSFWTTYELPAP
jgi:hypothetical protein